MLIIPKEFTFDFGCKLLPNVLCSGTLCNLSEVRDISSCIAKIDFSDSTGELLSYGDISPLEVRFESMDECLPSMENDLSD